MQLMTIDSPCQIEGGDYYSSSPLFSGPFRSCQTLGFLRLLGPDNTPRPCRSSVQGRRLPSAAGRVLAALTVHVVEQAGNEEEMLTSECDARVEAGPRVSVIKVLYHATSMRQPAEQRVCSETRAAKGGGWNQ